MKSKFLILALITIIPSLGFAAVFGDFEYKTSKSGVTILWYYGSNTSVEIPSQINNVPVKAIGAKAFYNRYNLTSVTIPSSVKSIGVNAFGGTQLTSIDVDTNNPVYKSVNGVLFNKALTTIIACPAGKSGSYEIPNSVKSIGANAFYGCQLLTSVTIPSSVESIGASAFYTCMGLTSVTIPNSVKSIGVGAFYTCFGLTSVTIPSSVTSIGAKAFSNCDGLTSVTISSSVKSIGASAFSWCLSLTGIDVDTRNPVYKSVDGVVFNKALTAIIACPAGKSGSYEIPNSVKSIGAGAFESCFGLTSVTIPNSVKSIGEEAFYTCDGLTSVTIPSSVKSIGVKAFGACTHLTSIDVDTNNPVYKSVDGVVFNKALTAIIACPSGKSGSYEIPNSVKSIGASAFYYCYRTSVTIPNSVKSIGVGAFADSGLTSVTIPSSVKSIGGGAFADCSGLTSVTIPSSVLTMGLRPFDRCSRLTSIYFRGAPPRVRSGFSLGLGLDANTCIAYYLPSMEKKWGASFGGIPTAVIVIPKPI